MKQLRIPTLFYPFIPSKNPHTQAVQDTSVAKWTRHMGFKPSDEGYRTLQLGEFGLLVGQCYPTASREDLELITDFATWLFLWDDQCDQEGQEGWTRRPERVRALNAPAQTLLLGGWPSRSDGPLLWGLWDILNRMRARASGRWLHRFTRHLQDYFEATEWQTTCLRDHLVPDIGTYARMRQFTSGVYMVMCFIEMAEDIELPMHVRVSPGLMNVCHSAVDVIAWANDIFSLQKELLHGDRHNLVIVLQHEKKSTLAQAIHAAAELHDAEVRRYVELERRLPSYGSDADAQVERFVAGLRSWMRANMDWSIVTGRYRPGVVIGSTGVPTGVRKRRSPTARHEVDRNRATSAKARVSSRRG